MGQAGTQLAPKGSFLIKCSIIYNYAHHCNCKSRYATENSKFAYTGLLTYYIHVAASACIMKDNA